MKRNVVRKPTLLRLLLPMTVLAWSACAQGQIGFADNEADRIRLWNANYYELAFRKADGRILYIVDKTTGQQVSPGNVHGPWVLRFSNNTWLDGENFSPSNPARLFTYSWNAQGPALTLDYIATGTYACHVTLTIVPTEGPEVDSTLSITSQSGYKIELLAYPVQLSFQRNRIDAVYVPYLEGMRLKPNFFESYELSARYPGRMFGDFAYTDLTVGSFAVYGLHDLQAPLKPSSWKILRDDSYGGGVSKYHHDYDVAISSGGQWSSPTTVLSVGSTLGEAMAAYWTRSGHANMPTLAEKLGAPAFEKLANAVLLKRDFLQGPWTFASFQSFLPNLPANNLLHLVAFWPNGFDEYYPDYLPPNPAMGTLAALQDLVAYARSSGHLVMPYTNPTWWDEESPTMASLGPGVVARDRFGGLIYESYNGHGGYVVSPHSPAVIARQDQTRDEFTLTVPCDFLFEDQIGARDAPTYAAHPDAPDPIEYTQGLIDVAARSAQWMPIMTEGGSDRLAWVEAGYCNSHTIGWHWWPSTTYTSYPMAPLWAHENLYFSAHNLAGTVMANDLPRLTYYIAIGYSLSHDLSMLEAEWLKVLDCLQKRFLSSLVGAEMTSFEDLATPGRTRTNFGNGTIVTANLTTTALPIDDHEVAVNGFLAEQNGHVRAGVLTRLHGQTLTGSSPHYLVFEYADYRIKIYQPKGDDGLLTVPRPVDWTDDDRIHATAVTTTGSTFNRPITIQPGTLQVDYLSSISGQSVQYLVLVYCLPGDTDCDGDVDLADGIALTGCLAGPGVSPSPAPPMTSQDCLDAFDADADIDVDMADFGAFTDTFTGDT